MTSKRRSPYLVLGVPFGASKGDAGKAFARATRRLRRSTAPPFDLEDLNWALHAVEQRVEDPSTSIDDYRMPADPALYEVPPGVGLLNPGVEPLDRRTPPSSSTDLEIVKADVIREVASAMAEEIEGDPLPTLHKFTEEGS